MASLIPTFKTVKEIWVHRDTRHKSLPAQHEEYGPFNSMQEVQVKIQENNWPADSVYVLIKYIRVPIKKDWRIWKW